MNGVFEMNDPYVSCQQNSRAIAHSRRQQAFSFARGGGAAFRRRPSPGRKRATGTEKYRGDGRIPGYRNDLPRGLDRRIRELAAQQRASGGTVAGRAGGEAPDAAALVAELDHAMQAAGVPDAGDDGGADGGGGGAPEPEPEPEDDAEEGPEDDGAAAPTVASVLHRMWRATAAAAEAARLVRAGAVPPLLALVSGAPRLELLSERGRGRARDVKQALLLLRRLCEQRRGRMAVAAHNAKDADEGGAEDANEGDGGSAGDADEAAADESKDGGGGPRGGHDDATTKSGATILLLAVTHGPGQMRRLAADVVERLARNARALDQLFEAGMRPALVSRSLAVRAAEIARLSKRPVTFRQPRESAMPGALF